MDNINKIEEQPKVLRDIQQVLDEIDVIIPKDWTRPQVGAALSAYMEFYK